MKQNFLYIILFSLILMVYNLYSKIEHLTSEIHQLEYSVPTKINPELKMKLLNLQMKDKADSVLSIRCSDSKNKKDNPIWKGTATKIGSKLVLTAHHVIAIDEENPRIAPIKCELYQKGKLVGEFNSKINKSNQIARRDIALLQVDFNEDGKKIHYLTPKIMNHEINIGDMFILITHPDKFINDSIITYGYVLKEHTEKLLESRSTYWKNSILTDMSAAPGSSGSPLFDLDGRFIGIHVGGERAQGLNINYQVLFDQEIYVYLNIFKLFI